jgi:hypothetical protein
MFERRLWKRFVVLSLGTAALLCVTGAVVLKSLKRVPIFYRAVDTLSAEERSTESRQFVRQSTAIFNQIENEPSWSGVFREQQVNAWLAGDFARKHAEVLPSGVTGPRVSFDDGRITLGFQMQHGPVAPVISACGRVWLPEPNFVAVELEAARAGAIPIPIRVIVDTVSAAAKSAGYQIDWREHAGRPVALLRLSEPEKPSAVQVDRVELREGLLYLSGRSAHRSAARSGDLSSGSTSEMSLSRQSSEATLQR